MRILIDIGHPAHVHLFKNFIWEMEKHGHQIQVTARDKDVVTHLLKAYGIPFIPVGKKGKGSLNLFREWILRDFQILNIARKFNPDILLGAMNPVPAHVAWLLGKTSINFTDSEPEIARYPIADLLILPFTDVILTLSSVKHDYGEKEVRVNSYKELAYLHPDRFTPDPRVIEQAGLEPGTEYALIRFVAWGAYHDAGQGGLSIEDKRSIIARLEKSCRVFISSESPLPAEFEQYRLPIPPEKMHDFLYYAKIFVSDSQTMTTEAALLGTPAVRCNSFVGTNDMGNFIELEDTYHLIFNCKDLDSVLAKIDELLQIPDPKNDWVLRKERVLSEKIDFTAFMVWLIENYPNRIIEKGDNPELQFKSASTPQISHDQRT